MLRRKRVYSLFPLHSVKGNFRVDARFSKSYSCPNRGNRLCLKWATGRKVWQGTVTPSRRRTPGSIPGSPTTLTPQIYIYAKSFTKVTRETPHRLTLRVFVIWALPHPQVHGCKGGKPEDGITELFRQHNRGRIGVSIGHKGHN